jgi:dolichol-phosphate mannosyltransferase
VRRIISRGGCLYARLVLQLGVHDLTGGFKCFHRRVLEAIELDQVGAEGYAFQIEMTYRSTLLGFRVVEVPIIFSDRVRGGSKMSRRIVAEAAWRVPQLRWRALRGRIPRRR